MGNRKICMLVANDVTSDPRVTKEARDLAKDWEVTVVGLNIGNNRPDAEQVDGYSILRGTSAGAKRKASNVSKMLRKATGMLKIAKLALKQKPAVFHAHDFEMLPIAYIAAKLKRCKLVYDSHELWIEQRSDFPKWFKWLVKKIEGFLIRRTDLVITVNESIAEELRKRYRLSRQPTILHNFTPLDLGATQLEQINSEQKQVVVLYHGGYLKDRGLRELVQSAHYLPSNISIHFRGMGPIEEQLRTEAGSLIQEGKIVFHPPVAMTELVKSAGTADIGFIPYQPTCLNNYFSLPNKLSEYAMAGLAICASDLPEIRKLNERVSFGHLFDPYSPRSMAEAIMATCVDRQTLLEYKRNSTGWSRTTGNWEAESVKLSAEYNQLLGVKS